MDYRALAKRSKQASTKSDKTITKTNRKGETKIINKYKRKSDLEHQYKNVRKVYSKRSLLQKWKPLAVLSLMSI
jgi:peptidyl-tRNA hydrolase